MRDNEIEITIWDDKGNVVVHEIVEAQTATEEEINAMVKCIDQGFTAEEAVKIVKR